MWVTEDRTAVSRVAAKANGGGFSTSRAGRRWCPWWSRPARRSPLRWAARQGRPCRAAHRRGDRRAGRDHQGHQRRPARDVLNPPPFALAATRETAVRSSVTHIKAEAERRLADG